MIEWKTSADFVDYHDALQEMQSRVKSIQEGEKSEQVWLLEHPPLYTSGSSADVEKEVVDLEGTPIYETGRGGKITYHGPGQRVGYVMLNLKNRKPDIRLYVHNLEEWLIRTLKHFDVTAERRDGRIGLWVETQNTEKKIAAIGVRVQKWVSFHGVALNVNPDLSYFNRIVPCGIGNYGVTSLADLGIQTTMAEVDKILKTTFEEVFGHGRT